MLLKRFYIRMDRIKNLKIFKYILQRLKFVKRPNEDTTNTTTTNNEPKVIQQINPEMIHAQIAKLYLVSILKEIKAEINNQYTIELEKQNTYKESLENRNSNTHIIILQNLQILQRNMGIINTALSEVESDTTETKQNIKKQIGCEPIIDIPLNKNRTKHVNIK